MYSVILMTAMTVAAPEAPQFGLRARGATHGCSGGYSYGGCAGCSGGCAGCSGGCVGCSGGGCYGGGCWGTGPAPLRGWNWAAGGYGGSRPLVVDWGHAPYVVVGYDGPVGPTRIAIDPWGADYTYSASVPFVYHSRFASPKSEKMEEPKESLDGAAKLILEVPAEAKVYIDDQPVKSTSDVRHFATPVLDPNQTYFYDVRVETVKDGRPVKLDRRVFVKANQIVRESFRSPISSAPGIASK